MNLKNRVQEWLGVSSIRRDNCLLREEIEYLTNLVTKRDREMSALFTGVSRIVARADSAFGDTPEKVQARLDSEAKIRARHDPL